MTIFWVALLQIQLFAQASVGRLTIETNPKAKVSIDGNPMGSTPVKMLKVSPGSHTVQLEIKKIGQQIQFPVRIQAGKHLKCSYDFDTAEQRCTGEKLQGAAAPVPVSKGQFVELRSSAPAEVFMDGILLGSTPIEGYAVSPGSHSFEFKADGFAPVKREVKVEEGQKVKVEVNFEAVPESSEAK